MREQQRPTYNSLAHTPVGCKILNAMAGLLTCSFNEAFPGKIFKAQWQKEFH